MICNTLFNICTYNNIILLIYLYVYIYIYIYKYIPIGYSLLAIPYGRGQGGHVYIGFLLDIKQFLRELEGSSRILHPGRACSTPKDTDCDGLQQDPACAI